MPRHCSAGGCKSRDNRETRNAGITFHRLPKGAPRRNLWITNSHRADSWDPQTDFVYFCSKHFTPENFELTGYSGIRRLKDDAFPTLFDSSSTTKSKRRGALQTKEDVPVRKNPCSGIQENAQQETDGGQSSEEPTVQSPVAAAGETNDNTPASSQEPSGMDCSPSAEAVCRPLSPSRYMRRLPPPPGFYLSKEHSYAQLCPLLWRRRYDQAIDCLEKALRQLHAARRRENRLRSTVLRLRDKRLKLMLMSQDGCKNRGSWTPGGEKRRGTGGSESESDAKCEDSGLFEDRCVDQMELGDTNSWSEEETGYCCYCGRGQVQHGGPVAHRGSKTVRSTVHEHSLKVQRRDESRTCGTAENAKDQQMVRLRRASGKSVETSDSNVIPAGVLLSDIHEQSVQLLGSQKKLLLSDACEGETEAPGQDHHLEPQQLFWIQDQAEGQLILVPLAAGDGLQSSLKTEGVADETKTLLVSEMETHKGELGHMTESRGCVSRVKTACDDEHSEQSSVLNTTEDVREKLKEHLEGFHLQLSTEFTSL